MLTLLNENSVVPFNSVPPVQLPELNNEVFFVQVTESVIYTKISPGDKLKSFMNIYEFICKKGKNEIGFYLQNC